MLGKSKHMLKVARVGPVISEEIRLQNFIRIFV
jgi:hypothetical protein